MREIAVGALFALLTLIVIGLVSSVVMFVTERMG